MRRARNHLLFLARVALSNVRRLPFPYKLTLLLTNRCNCRCTICSIWRQERREELSLEAVRTFFAASNRFSWIDLSGGEIFLRDDLPEIFATVIERCRDLVFLHFPTNGLLTERIVAGVEGALALKPPRLVVTVSLDGPREVHDAARGVAGSFDKAVETYRALAGLPGCHVFFGLTLSTVNLGRFVETVEAVRERVPRVTADDFHINVAQRSPHYYGNPDLPLPPPEVLARELAVISSSRSRSWRPAHLLERRYLALAGAYLASGRPPVPCRALSATCFVNAAGVLYPCLTIDRPLGTLEQSGFDLARVWREPEVEALARQIRRGDCPGCWTACEAFPAIGGNLLRLVR